MVQKSLQLRREDKKVQIGNIVKSMSGHDKDSFYIVVKCENEFAYIVDGRSRKLLKPKRKNTKHLAKTKIVVDMTKLDTDKKVRRQLWDLNFNSQDSVAD